MHPNDGQHRLRDRIAARRIGPPPGDDAAGASRLCRGSGEVGRRAQRRVGGSPHSEAARTTDDEPPGCRQPGSISHRHQPHPRHGTGDQAVDRPRPPPRRPGRPAVRRVVIAGAGVGALEALLALRALMPHGLQIDILAPGESFLYRPVSIAESLRATEPPTFDLDALLRDQQVRRHVDALASVDIAERTVHTRSGSALPYDELIMATGPRLVSALRGALALRGRAEVPAARATILELEEGRLSRLACVLPADSRAWPIPIYELALAAAARAPAASVSIVTAEPNALAALGHGVSAAVTALLARRGIELLAGARAVAFEDGRLRLEDGRTLQADRVIALPRLAGPAIAGLPADDQGFLPIDDHGRVVGAEAVYAAGDATNFPIKQGALAAAQADAIARLIAARAGAPVDPAPFRPVARGLLLCGAESRYVRVSPDAEPLSAPASIRRAEPGWAEGALWWPFSRSVGRHLAPLLAGPAGGGRAWRGEPGPVDSVALWLTLAEHDSQAEDRVMALESLERAEALGGALPARFAQMREAWRAQARSERTVGATT